jgi:D-alanyl-D-alanine carboxypeptidase-like protein
MATSQNGWSVDPKRVKVIIGGVELLGGVRAGDVATVLEYVATQFDKRVERLIEGHCWGYASRPIRGQSTGYSNHASATAVDLNAPEHGRGKRGTFSPKQVAEIHEILREVRGAVRWGGDYSTGMVDEMHFEIIAGATFIGTVADMLHHKATREEDDMTDDERKQLSLTYQAVWGMDGKGGPVHDKAGEYPPIMHTLAKLAKQVDDLTTEVKALRAAK